MTTAYALTDIDGELVECDSCHSQVPVAPFDWGPPFTETHPTPKRWLCEFCSSTMASRHTRYPSNDMFSMLRAEIWRAAGAVANHTKKP